MANIDIQARTIGTLDFPSTSLLKVEYVNGMKEGPGKVLSDRRIILAELNFCHDQLDGLCTLFDSKGHKCKECMFTNGVYNGWYCEYKDDRVSFTGMYKNGARYSQLIEYEDDKSMYKEMRNDTMISLLHLNSKHERDGICYDFDYGKISLVAVYENGKKVRDMYSFRGNIMREYDEKGNLVYSGEYEGNWKDGFVRKVGVVKPETGMSVSGKQGQLLMKDDKMTEYNKNGQVIYKGNHDQSGKRSGKGQLYEYLGNSCNVYTSTDGVKERLLYEVSGSQLVEFGDNNSVVYKGSYVLDKNGSYLYDGVGTTYDHNQTVYSGEWVNGKKEGKGKLYKSGGASFDGMWKDDLPNGYGVMSNENGKAIHSGKWNNGYLFIANDIWVHYDTGKEYGFYPNGKLKYNGDWKDRKPHGIGTYYFQDGRSITGEWKEGELEFEPYCWYSYTEEVFYIKHECGTIIYVGEIKDGKPNGSGQFLRHGEVAYEGHWVNGQFQYARNEYIRISDGHAYRALEYSNNSSFSGCKNSWNVNEIVVCESTTYSNINTVLSSIKAIKNKAGTFAIESSHLIQQLNSPELKNKLVTLSIQQGVGNHETSVLIICKFAKLRSIIFGLNSFKNVASLQILDNPLLTEFTVENGDTNEDISACTNAKSLSFSSTFRSFSFHSLDLPSLTSINIGSFAFYNTLSLSLSNLPVLARLILEKYAFFKVRKLTIRSVPVSTMLFKRGSNALLSVKASGVSSDSASQKVANAIISSL